MNGYQPAVGPPLVQPPRQGACVVLQQRSPRSPVRPPGDQQRAVELHRYQPAFSNCTTLTWRQSPLERLERHDPAPPFGCPFHVCWTVRYRCAAAFEKASGALGVAGALNVTLLQEFKLVLNGQDRFKAQSGAYFNEYQPYQYHSGCPYGGCLRLLLRAQARGAPAHGHVQFLAHRQRAGAA